MKEAKLLNSLEARLNESEYQMENIFEGLFSAVNAGVVVITPRGRIKQLNKVAENLLACKSQDVAGLDFAMFIPSSGEAVVKETLSSVSKKNPRTTLKIKLLTKDYTVLKANLTSQFLSVANEDLIILTIEDLSEVSKLKEELKLANNRLSSLVDTLSIYLWSLDEELRFVTANNAAKNIFKKSFDYDFEPGDHVMDLYHKRSDTNTELWLERYNATLKTGESQFFELAEVFYGRFSHIMVELHPIKSQNKINGISCLVKNDTNTYLKNRLNQALSNFKSKVLNINSINDLLWAVTDEVLAKLHLEDAVILMKKNDSLQIKTAFGSKRVGNRRINSPLNIKVGKGVTGSVALTGQPEIVNNVKDDDRYFEVHFQAGSEIVVPIILGGDVIGVINCESIYKNFFKPIHLEILTEVASVTAEKINRIISERKLRRMEELNRAVLNSTPNSYLLINSRMQVESFNRTAFKTFAELTGNLMKGVDIRDYISNIYLEEFESLFDQALSGKMVTTQTEFNHPKGKDSWIRVTFSPAINSSRSIFGVTLIIEDITRQKRDENLILQQNQDLIKANQELDRFVYSVSHDLRSPVSSVMGLTTLIKMTEEMEEIQSYNDLIADSMDRMDNFIRNILDYSRNSRVEVDYNEFDIQEMIEGILADHSYVDGFRNIEIKKDIQISSVYLDKQRVGIILRNLISNAAKYHDYSKDNRFISISIKEDEMNYLIKISDNGQGIDNRYLTNLFNMFFTANKKSNGSGIGLYIVKEAVTALKGYINVTSELNKGSAFTVTIPKHI